MKLPIKLPINPTVPTARRLTSLPSLLVAFTLSACGTSGRHASPDSDGGDTGGTGSCSAGSHRCYGPQYQGCASGMWSTEDTCMAACDAMLGCVPCTPGQKFCDGDAVKTCNLQGQPAATITTCQAGACVNGSCTDPCGKAASEFSYIGCDYFPTVTVNNVLIDEKEKPRKRLFSFLGAGAK